MYSKGLGSKYRYVCYVCYDGMSLKIIKCQSLPGAITKSTSSQSRLEVSRTSYLC